MISLNGDKVYVHFPRGTFLSLWLSLYLELTIQKLEQEKTNRDHTIKSLNEEITNQEDGATNL